MHVHACMQLRTCVCTTHLMIPSASSAMFIVMYTCDNGQ
jgi:hypothetical protein